MKLSTTQSFRFSRERVFDAILDPAVLQASIEGCEKLVSTGENSYEAELRVGVAVIKGRYKGKIEMREKVRPESFTLVIEGKGTSGFVRSTARVILKESGEGTELLADVDAVVGGLIAAVGSRLVEGVAKKMMGDFFKKLGEEIGRIG